VESGGGGVEASVAGVASSPAAGASVAGVVASLAAGVSVEAGAAGGVEVAAGVVGSDVGVLSPQALKATRARMLMARTIRKFLLVFIFLP
jgi:hypothetical protein